MKDPGWVLFRLHIRHEVVILDRDVLGSRAQLGFFSQREAACVVFETLGINLGFRQIEINVVGLQFFKEMKNKESVSERIGQGDILGLCCGQCDEILKLACPMNGTSSELENITAPGFDIFGIGRVSFVPCSREICVGIALEDRFTTHGEDEAFVLGPEEVSNNALDCDIVGFARIITIARTLVHSKCDVGSRGSSQIIQLTEDASIIERCVLGRNFWGA